MKKNLLFVALLVCLTACQSGLPVNDQKTRKTAALLAGKVWLRPIGHSFEGFYLFPDQKMLLVNIYSMTGKRWFVDGQKLTFYTNTERYPRPEPNTWRLSFKNQQICLTPEKTTRETTPLCYSGSEPGYFSGVWQMDYAANREPKKSMAIIVEIPKVGQNLRIKTADQNIRAEFKCFGSVGVAIQIDQEFDDFLFFDFFHQTNHFIVARNRLFFYSDTDLLLSFTRL